MNLGNLYEKFNKPDLSLKYYIKSLQINPENALFFYKNRYFNQSRIIKARENLEKSIKINKYNKEAIDFLNKINKTR